MSMLHHLLGAELARVALRALNRLRASSVAGCEQPVSL